MGKTIGSVVGIIAAVAIVVAAPYLAPAFLVAAVGTSVATAITMAVLSIGLMLAFNALGIGAPKADKTVGPPQVFRQTISDSFIVYGKRRVGGLLVFYHPRKSGSRNFRYFVIACAGHRCKGLVSFMLGDEVVTVDGSGKVTSGKYANAAWLWFQRGLPSETANATFVSECGGKWTADHKGNDTAAIYAKFEMTDAVVQAGMPNITAIVEGKDDILDPRTTTEGYSRNATLIFYDWMKTPREEGGFGAYLDEIPDDTWISAQANACDETVNGQPRYAIDAVITTGASPGEVRDVMVVNQAGSYTYSGGKHLMRPGYWVPVSQTLSEDDLAAAIQVSPFMPSDAAANEVQGTYISPDDNYQGMPLSTWTTDPAPTDIRQLHVDLAFVTNKDQGDRILGIMGRRAQAEKTVTWPMNIAGLKVRAMDTAQLNTSRYGLSNYAFSVANWALSADYGIVLQLREENEEIYSDGSPIAPIAPPALDKPEPITLEKDITRLISLSGTRNLTFSITDAGAASISGHERVYLDKVVSVTGTGGTPIATGAASGKYVSIFYDQEDRSGGAVTYQYLITDPGQDNSAAYASPDFPFRHFVAIMLVPASGSSGGGSSPGDGGGASGPGGPGTAHAV